MKLVIAEKPSVARDIAQALGLKSPPRGGYIEGEGYVITWAVGHLVTLAEPHDINPVWQKWRFTDLPILPASWPLTVLPKTSDQFELIRRLIDRPDVQSLVAATDAGREGELIFRYIAEKAGCHKPVERLWLSSLTTESIKKAFRELKPLSAYDRLADNARGRSRADWLVGLNLSRAYSLKYNDRWAVGRVQTPTLAMVVERTEAIESFVPEAYEELEGVFAADGASPFKALYVDPESSKNEIKRFAPEAPERLALEARIRAGHPSVLKREDREQKQAPPKLYDLTDLQKDANRLFGYQAKQTLDIAQSLYETHKLITYPRTDSPYLSEAVAAQLPSIVPGLLAPFEKLRLAPDTGVRALGPAYVDDSKVSDHHAILPTGRSSSRLNEAEARVYDLIVRRLLMAWQPDHVKSQATLLVRISDDTTEAEPIFKALGSVVIEAGWRKLETRKAIEGHELPLLKAGEALRLESLKALKKETRPPPPFNDASLLNGMASAGSRLDDRELSGILRERGLGTPATRAATIEGLILKGYIERRDKALVATPLGCRLIHHVHPSVRSAALTGEWEAKLKAIESGKLPLAQFMDEIVLYVQETIELVRGQAVSPELLAAGRAPAQASPRTADRKEPKSRQGASAASPPDSDGIPSALGAEGLDAREALAKVFGHSRFRSHQETICREIIAGRDLLLVMPTGAGKSLCYQLPAVVRGGCTIVISPLIALMDDQVMKLKELGVPAAALHSGLSREASRAIFRRYLDGELKLLYLAPERLGLSGFMDFLIKYPPSLIAIDEAHCISQWGHDFRPDYRMLSQRLAPLRPAPVVAMTATATPMVQKDIVDQLGLHEPKLHIHGFRRTNIAIEISEIPLPDRPELVMQLLKRPGALPAIVYAPTRKETEKLEASLARLGKVSSYHAGLSHEKRQGIQSRFSSGDVDVIIATIAFGMGIDKGNIRTVIHTALPSSVEAYYQEIGRAGRDGQLSRAILLHSYADHRTREFFIKKNYPDADVLQTIMKAIPKNGIQRSALRVRMPADEVDNALEKLWVHGAIELTEQDDLLPTGAEWKKSYLNQQIHKQTEVALMSEFAQNQVSCRMLLFLKHFGDTGDQLASCGICDVCAPDAALTKKVRAPSEGEQALLHAIHLELLGQSRSTSASKVLAAVEGSTGRKLDRRHFDSCLDAMVRAGLVWSRQDSFEKDGRTISYRAIGISAQGQSEKPDWSSFALIGSPEPTLTTLPRAGAKRSTKRTPTRTSSRAGAVSSSLDEALVQKLRGWRLRRAKSEKIRAYQVFSDKTLEALVLERPQSEDELEAIDGLGPVRLQKYAREILQLLGG